MEIIAVIGIISFPKPSNQILSILLSPLLNHKACMVIKSQEKFHESEESNTFQRAAYDQSGH